MDNLITGNKKKIVSREQLKNLSRYGKPLTSSQTLRRSPGNNRTAMTTLSDDLPVKRRLFSSSSSVHEVVESQGITKENNVGSSQNNSSSNVYGSFEKEGGCNMIRRRVQVNMTKNNNENEQNRPLPNQRSGTFNQHVQNRTLLPNSQRSFRNDVNISSFNDPLHSSLQNKSSSVDLQQHTSRFNQHDEEEEGSELNNRNEGGYNVINRRRVEAHNPKNDKGRGPNKLKMNKNAEFVDVNEHLQPIGDSARKLSTFIGVFARDPRKLPLDCFDWRTMDLNKKNSIWAEVKHAFSFPEGREPYDWVITKMNECWRGYKSDLKSNYFDNRSYCDAINNRPPQIPEDPWRNLVAFWESDKGKERSERGSRNRKSNKMCQYAGSKSFARIRAEEEAKGNDTSKLAIWLKTHEPKKGSKLDDVSCKAKQTIENELAHMEESSCDATVRNEIFNKVIGEDKYGYAKTFGIGKKVPRSNSKRCALEEERAKRIKVEKECEENNEKIQNLEKNAECTERKLGHLKELLKMLLQHQGAPKDILASLDMDDEDQGDNAKGVGDTHENDYEYEPNDENVEGVEDFDENQYI